MNRCEAFTFFVYDIQPSARIEHDKLLVCFVPRRTERSARLIERKAVIFGKFAALFEIFKPYRIYGALGYLCGLIALADSPFPYAAYSVQRAVLMNRRALSPSTLLTSNVALFATMVPS